MLLAWVHKSRPKCATSTRLATGPSNRLKPCRTAYRQQERRWKMNTMHRLLGDWEYIVMAALWTVAVITLTWQTARGTQS